MKKVKSSLLVFLCVLTMGAKTAKTVRLDEKTVSKVHVVLGRSTILSFPSKPSKVILGSHGAFKIEYVESDIAIAALSPNSKSNVFVYVDGRRFAFDLVTIPTDGDEIVMVRDEQERNTKVKIHE